MFLLIYNKQVIYNTNNNDYHLHDFVIVLY